MSYLLSPDFIANPYPYYRRLRSVEPVSKMPDGPWLVTRYDDANRVLRDRRFVRSIATGFRTLYGPRAFDEPALAILSRWVLLADPPGHTPLRSLMMKAFGARPVSDLRPRIQQLADQLVDDALSRGGIEIVRDYARALSLTLICEVLGIPDEDRPLLPEHFGFTSAILSGLPLDRAEIDRVNRQVTGLERYFRGFVERRRRRPADDLTSQLAQVEEDGERLSEEELIANLVLSLVAGHETTTDLIANGLLTLHRYPAELQRLTREPGMAANAVDELLRFETPVKYVARAAAEDVEFGDKIVKAGDWVFAFLAAANRDPAMFASPDRLDIGRANIRPLSFGGGVHFCIGAQLGRLEAEIAITTLLRRLPSLKIRDLERPRWRSTAVFRGLEELHASW